MTHLAQFDNTHTLDDLEKLLEILPDSIRTTLQQHPQRDSLVEVVMDLGRQPEARFPTGSEFITTQTITLADLDYAVQRVGQFGGDNRAGIERTLHRISAIRNRSGAVIGLTCRVGRAVFGTIAMIRDLVESGRSILMLGRPGVGKTTALREIARLLADEFNKRVVIIDTSNEIAGDGDIPHPAIGRARRMQVSRPELQHQVMVEAVENHMPEVIVIDEIGTELEALAARTIAERGVQLVGTAHGNCIANLVKNPTLSDLIGGIQSVTLGDDEARRRGSQKSVLERKAPPTFEIAVEMLERQQWVVHEDVADTIDRLLRGQSPTPQIRTLNEQQEVIITQEAVAETAPLMTTTPVITGWRASGKMLPPGTTKQARRNGYSPSLRAVNGSSPQRSLPDQEIAAVEEFDQLLEASMPLDFAESEIILTDQPLGIGPNGEDLPLHVYPYGISRTHLEQVVRTLQLPVVLTKDIDSADAVLALRAHVKNHAKIRQLAKSRQIPIHTLKSNTLPQVAHTLRRILDLDTGLEPTLSDLDRLYQSGDEDELEALEETRLAVEQIVIPKGQPVELLPRSARVRKMQHELVEHYHLKSHSFGDEPNRRIRIYPA